MCIWNTADFRNVFLMLSSIFCFTDMNKVKVKGMSADGIVVWFIYIYLVIEAMTFYVLFAHHAMNSWWDIIFRKHSLL